MTNHARPAHPRGPIETEPLGYGPLLLGGNAHIILDALAAAGVELGAYDRHIADQLGADVTFTALTVAAWITRASETGALAFELRADAATVGILAEVIEESMTDPTVWDTDADPAAVLANHVRDLARRAAPPDAPSDGAGCLSYADSSGAYVTVPCRCCDGAGPRTAVEL